MDVLTGCKTGLHLPVCVLVLLGLAGWCLHQVSTWAGNGQLASARRILQMLEAIPCKYLAMRLGTKIMHRKRTRSCPDGVNVCVQVV